MTKKQRYIFTSNKGFLWNLVNSKYILQTTVASINVPLYRNQSINVQFKSTDLFL